MIGTSTASLASAGSFPAAPCQADESSVSRLRVVEVHASGDIGIEGVLLNSELYLVVYGELDAATIPRLETVLDGLLMLRPRTITVEIERAGDCDFEARQWMGERADDIVRFCFESSAEDAEEPLGRWRPIRGVIRRA